MIRTGKKVGLCIAAFMLILLVTFTLVPTAKAADLGTIRVNYAAENRVLMYMKALDFAQGNETGKGSYTVPAELKEGYKSYLKENAAAFSLTVAQIDGFSDAALNSTVQQIFSDETKFTEAMRRDFAVKFAKIGEDKGMLKLIDKKRYQHLQMGGYPYMEVTDLPLGYYIIVDKTTEDHIPNGSTRSLVMLTTTEPDAEIYLKASYAGGRKYVYDSISKKWAYGGKETRSNEVVKFLYEVRLPDEFSSYKRYTLDVTDTMSKGLVLTEDPTAGGASNITVFTGKLDKSGKEVIYTLLKRASSRDCTDGDYYISVGQPAQDGSTTWSIYFSDLTKGTLRKSGIVRSVEHLYIRYSAKTLPEGLDENALCWQNTASHKYSNDPQVDDGGMPLGQSTPSQVKLNYYKLTITKENDENPAKALSGAEFELKGNGLTTLLVLDKDGRTLKVPGGESNVTATTDEDGKLTIVGLIQGDYTLTETKAPDGYNVLSEPIQFKVHYTMIQKRNVLAFTVTNGQGKFKNPRKGEITIVNKQGSVIPGLGGTGTTLLYVVGSVVAIASAIYIVSKKRADEKSR